jgi:hypothetical protein
MVLLEERNLQMVGNLHIYVSLQEGNTKTYFLSHQQFGVILPFSGQQNQKKRPFGRYAKSLTSWGGNFLFF